MSTKNTAPTRKAAESGVVRLDGTLITYTSQHYGSFSIPLSEVAVIGEFTTDNGPVIDDWFLVFVSRSGNEWFEASMYAEGIEPFREQLSAALGSSNHRQPRRLDRLRQLHHLARRAGRPSAVHI